MNDVQSKCLVLALLHNLHMVVLDLVDDTLQCNVLHRVVYSGFSGVDLTPMFASMFSMVSNLGATNFVLLWQLATIHVLIRVP